MPVAAIAAVAPAAAETASAATPAAPADPVALGAELVEDNGCTACHSAGTEKLVGPGWGGLYGREVTLTDGTKVKADDTYLKESILKPDAQIVAGFSAGVMPSFADILEPDQVTNVVAYLRSLGGEGK